MKRVVFASILALLIISGVALSWFYYQQYKVPQAEPITLVPQDACLVIEANNIEALSEHLKGNTAWDLLRSFPTFSRCSHALAYLDSARRSNEKINAALNAHPLCISAHITRVDAVDFLFLTALPRTGQETYVNEFISSVFGSNGNNSKRLYSGETIREIDLGGSVFSYTFTRGIFAGSFDAVLVEDAIRQSKQKQTAFTESDFMKVKQAAGKKVDANVFIRYENFSRLISMLVSPENKTLTAPLSHLASWSGLDLKTKTNAITLSGYTVVKDSIDYLSVFAGQQAQSMQLLSILPKRTAVFAYTSFSNLKSYLNRTRQLQHKSADAHLFKSVADLSKEYAISIEEKLLPVVGNEFALAITEPGSGTIENHAYAIFNCGDISRAKKNLADLTSAEQGHEAAMTKNFVPEQSEDYKGRTIGFLGIPNLLPALFGNDFEKMEKVFYTFINDYAVFANQASSLRSFIDDFDAKKLMIHDPGYQSITSTLSTKSNRFVYVNLQRSSGLISSLAQDSLASMVRSMSALKKGYSAFTFQASGDGNLVYTHSMLHHYPVKMSDASLVWSAQLDTSISSTPWFVTNPKTGERQVLVQDDANVLYFIGTDGEIIWKDSLSEKIMSDIFQVDYYRNEKYQFVFNTASKIYMLDRKGERMKNYPYKLPAEATAGMMVYDYEKKKEYRMFVPSKDHKLYALQLNTKPIDGWYFNHPLNCMEFPLQYFKLADKDFLVAADTTGDVYILDRRGKPRAEMKEKISTRFTRPFTMEAGKNIESSRLVTSDKSGKIVSVFFNGAVQMKLFKEVSPEHFFDCEDMNADQSADYIFLDNNTLSVFNQDSTPIFSRNFTSDQHVKPIVFRLSGSRPKIGLVSVSTNEISLFNDDGSLCDGFPLKGSTGFQIDVPVAGGKMNVLVGSKDKNIYLYALE